METDILLSWSGGKDNALALQELFRTREYTVRALLTTVTEEFDRMSMHGVRRSLLSAQASSLRLPVEEVDSKSFRWLLWTRRLVNEP